MEDRDLGIMIGELTATSKTLVAEMAIMRAQLTDLAADRERRRGAFHFWQFMTGASGLGFGAYLAKLAGWVHVVPIK